MLQRHGWSLLGHALLLDQLDRLIVAAERARQADPAGWEGDANVKLLAALRDLMLDRVPRDPLAAAFRQGNTPDDWPKLLAAAQARETAARFAAVAPKP